MIEAVLPSRRAWPLHGAAATRQIEQAAQLQCAPHALMAEAGLAVARLALAVAPHARTVWVMAGPGNNGGDGLVAARHLHAAGRDVRVALLVERTARPADAEDALQQARQAGVRIEPGLPDRLDAHLAIDALLGVGAARAPQGPLALAIDRMNECAAPVLAVDLPTGLGGDTGQRLGDRAVHAEHTLSLLTLKPGLFTALGRDHAGRIWFDDLGVEPAPTQYSLAGPPTRQPRQHAQHKGSFGDLVVIGGAAGMAGAAALAARAALTAGAGRVYLSSLDPAAATLDATRPELMCRRLAIALEPAMLGLGTTVCGCGGGSAVRDVLPPVLHHACRLVLDADALNAVAADSGLSRALKARAARGLHTVLTPHPLEAARLLNCTAEQVQADRLCSAQQLAARYEATIVLKGSGSVIASVDGRVSINPTGNARLGTAGSGDVLAGWTGGLWAQSPGSAGAEAASCATWLHGYAAQSQASQQLPLLAADLIDAMAQASGGLA